jgi:hypothetical protein
VPEDKAVNAGKLFHRFRFRQVVEGHCSAAGFAAAD